jgi:hypothetical protein
MSAPAKPKGPVGHPARSKKTCKCRKLDKKDRQFAKGPDGGELNVRLPSNRLPEERVFYPLYRSGKMRGTPLLDGTGGGQVRGWVAGSIDRGKGWKPLGVRLNYAQEKYMPLPELDKLPAGLAAYLPRGLRTAIKNKAPKIKYVLAYLVYMDELDPGETDIDKAKPSFPLAADVPPFPTNLPSDPDKADEKIGDYISVLGSFVRSKGLIPTTGWVPLCCFTRKAQKIIERELRCASRCLGSYNDKKQAKKTAFQKKANLKKSVKVRVPDDINVPTYDSDGYSPPGTVDDFKRLLEYDLLPYGNQPPAGSVGDYYPKTPDSQSAHGYFYLSFNVGPQGGVATDVFALRDTTKVRICRVGRKRQKRRGSKQTVPGARYADIRVRRKSNQHETFEHYVYVCVTYREDSRGKRGKRFGWLPQRALRLSPKVPIGSLPA